MTELIRVTIRKRTLEQALFALSTVAWDPEQLAGVRDEAGHAVVEIRAALNLPHSMPERLMTSLDAKP